MEEQKQPNKVNLLNQSDNIKSDIKQDFPESPKKQYLPKWSIIIVIIIGIIAIGVVGYYFYPNFNFRGCTEDAKVCPDGSTVGRVFPICEFKECPESPDAFYPCPADAKGCPEGTTLGEIPSNCKVAPCPNVMACIKICPDDSRISRIAPDCEFAECPEVIDLVISEYNTKNYEYKLIELGDWYNTDHWDQQLIRINRQTKEEETVIDSVKAALSDLQDRFNSVLVIFAQPLNSDKIILSKVMYATDNPGKTIYSFDVNNKEFTKMNNINNIYSGSFNNPVFSPDYRKMIWISGVKATEKNMYLFNLMTDDYSIIIELQKSETFNSAVQTRDCFGGICFDYNIEWLDNNTIRYVVYDSSSLEFIGNREISLE